jgi:predicted O-methyltransferase YrrM
MSPNLHQIKHFLKHFLTATRKGHGVHSPFAYRLCEEVFYNEHSFYDFKILNDARERLLTNEQIITVEDFGVGSKTFKGSQRKIKDLAARGISTRRQSEILYRLSNFLKCKTGVELGTSLGLNSLYLASVNPEAVVISIEGSKSLADFASQLASANGIRNIQFVQALFDDALPGILTNMEGLDLLYVDGNHSYAATMRYFKLALEKKHPSSVFVFDDIYWSREMTKAWKEIKAHPSVTLSIDTFFSGIVFFREEIKEKRDLKFYL